MPTETTTAAAMKDSRRVLSISFTYVLTLCVVYKVVSLGLFAIHVDGAWLPIVYGLTAAIALLGVRIGYADSTLSYKVLLRSILALVLFYVVASHLPFPDSLTGDSAVTDFELNVLWWIAAVCGGVAFVRPSFAIVPLAYVVWYKTQVSYVFGLNISWLDYTAVIETGMMLVIGLLILPLFRRFGDLDKLLAEEAESDPAATRQGTVRLHPVDLLVLTAVALHFGNYFYAAVLKAGLGSHPLFWVLENQTQYLILAAQQVKVLPISFSDWLTNRSFEAFSQFRILANVVTIGIQFLAVVAIVRIRWAIIVTIVYDIFHIGIYVFTGIFFWKFILLNLSIVAALAPIRNTLLTGPQRLALAVAVLVSPLIFHIAPSFAWLDSRSMNQVHFYAVTDDGSELEVPSNYFLPLSVTVAQQRLVWPRRGPFPTWTWGTTREQDIMERGLACDWDHSGDSVPEAAYHLSKVQIVDLMSRYHKLILHNVDSDGRIAYNRYPHHIFSLPWRDQEFNALDKRRIVAYRYLNEAICLEFADGKPRVDKKWSAGFDIPVNNKP